MLGEGPVDILEVGGLAAARGPIIDDLALDLSFLEIDYRHVIRPEARSALPAVAVLVSKRLQPVLFSHHITRFEDRKAKFRRLNSVDNRVICAIEKSFYYLRPKKGNS
jgi:hypothetical protein